MSRDDLKWYGLTTLSAVGGLLTIMTFFQGGPGFIFFFFISVAALHLRAALTQSKSLDERQVQMQHLAEELDFDFQLSAPVNVLGWSNSFELTRQSTIMVTELEKTPLPKWIPGLLPKSTSVLSRSIADIDRVVFDCPVPASETRQQQTVVALQSRDLEFSHFGLYPKDGLDGITSRFRRNVSVHGNYRFMGTDNRVFESIADSVLELLEGTWSLEAGEGFLLLYHSQELANPGVIDAMIRCALEIHAVLAERTPVEAESTLVPA